MTLFSKTSRPEKLIDSGTRASRWKLAAKRYCWYALFGMLVWYFISNQFNNSIRKAANVGFTAGHKVGKQQCESGFKRLTAPNPDGTIDYYL